MYTLYYSYFHYLHDQHNTKGVKYQPILALGYQTYKVVHYLQLLVFYTLSAYWGDVTQYFTSFSIIYVRIEPSMLIAYFMVK